MVSKRYDNSKVVPTKKVGTLRLNKENDEVTLVFGASLNPIRYSNIVIHKLRSYGYRCIALGLRKGVVSNVEINTFEEEIENIHTITMYIGAKRQEEYIDQILGYNPKRIIFNPGAENLKLYQLAKNRGIQVENACTLVLLSLDSY